MVESDSIFRDDLSESYQPYRLQSIQRVPVRSDHESLREDILHEFFGTRLDKEKSIFVISMLSLITAFFVVSAFSATLDLILGAIIVCCAVYAGFRWARQMFTSEL